MLAQIFDSSEANRLGKKFKPMKRPWPAAGGQRFGKTNLSSSDAKDLLRQNARG